MCGLFGAVFHENVVRKKKHTVRALMTALTILNDDRGGHAWGFVLPHSGVIRKGLGKAARMGAKTFDMLVSEPVLIAHTRWATQGAKEVVENAHPFIAGDIIGAHNGTLSNHFELNRKHDRKCQVDSNHIFMHLDEGKDLSEIQAYGAVTFIERSGSPDQVFVARFNGGMLSITEVPGYGWIWSSDDDHLKTALSFAGVPNSEILETTPETLVSVTAEKGLEIISDFAPGSPNVDPSYGRHQYRGYYNTADSDYYEGLGRWTGNGYVPVSPRTPHPKSTGCGYSYISTSQKSDAEAEKKALMAVDTSAAGTELEDILDAARDALLKTDDPVVEREIEARADQAENLIMELEWKLEAAEELGHTRDELEQLRELLEEQYKLEYEAWLEDREEEKRTMQSIGNDDDSIAGTYLPEVYRKNSGG